jgi:hypothetical protein
VQKLLEKELLHETAKTKERLQILLQLLDEVKNSSCVEEKMKETRNSFQSSYLYLQPRLVDVKDLEVKDKTVE